MKTTFSTDKIEVRVLSFSSRSQAMAYLGDSGFIDLTGEESKRYRCHFRVIEWGKGRRYLLASATDDELWLVQCSGGDFIWAYDRYLYLVSQTMPNPKWIRDCGEPIWNVLIHDGAILVHTELGLHRFDMNGTIRWQMHVGELVDTVEVDNGVVILRGFERKTQRISFETGQLIEREAGKLSNDMNQNVLK